MSAQRSNALRAALFVFVMLLLAGAAAADGDPAQGRIVTGARRSEASGFSGGSGTSAQKVEADRLSATQESACLMVESAAKANNLPLEFFARIIWQESRFQPNAIGPVTRSGQRAQGIAQFMPETARERLLLDPFDPLQALPKAAEYLNDMRVQFGNLGLAAAAYNAGPRRVREWLSGSGPMPQETRNYVLAVTGISVEEWGATGKNDKVQIGSQADCQDLIALFKRAPNDFVARLDQRIALAALKPWGAQVAAGFGRDEALAMYARAMKGLSGIISHQSDPLLSRAPGTTSFYQVRIGTNTRREAIDLCVRIRRESGACIVKHRGA